MAPATELQLQQLYIAYFGRPGDRGGLDYWLSEGISTTTFASTMYAQPEFQSANSGLSVSSQVNQIYLNLFGRNADNEGLLYWTNQINSGALQLASIANDLIYACNVGEALAADIAALASKTDTAILFTAELEETEGAIAAYVPQVSGPGWVSGANFVSAVTFMNTATASNTPTAAQVTAEVASIVANGVPGPTIALTTELETVPSSGAMATNTTVTGVINGNDNSTFQTGDIINGNATSTLSILGAAAPTVAPIVSINTLDTINVQALGNVTINAYNFDNVANIDVVHGTAAVTLLNADINTTYTFADGTDAAEFTATFRTSQLTGDSDTVNLVLDNVVSSSGILIGNSSGIETLSLTVSGTASQLASLLLGGGTTALVIEGDVDLTVTGTLANGFTSIDATSLDADLSIKLGTGSNTVASGSGDDTIVAGTGANLINSNDGNDTLDFQIGGTGNLTVLDSINGGLGSNTLIASGANIDTNADLDDAVDLRGGDRVSNIQTLNVTGIGGTAGTDTEINANRVDASITTVQTVAATGNQAATFTFNTGASTLNLGGLLGAATTFVAFGTGTSDSLTVVKNYTANNSAFNGVALTLTGIETITFDGGSTAVALTQAIGAISMAPTTTNAALNITLVGENEVSLGAVTTTGTGVLTIDGSGLATQSAGTTLTVSAPVTTGGTVSIVGSGGADNLSGDINDSNTIIGGAGADTITGGSAADSISGGTGADSITTGAGNDFIYGHAGNDIVIVGGNLDLNDTVNGGTGDDTLIMTGAVTASNAANVTNFEYLYLSNTGNVTQDLYELAAGNTLTLVGTAGAIADGATIAFTNAASTTNTLDISATPAGTGGIVSFARRTDTSSESFTVDRSGTGASAALTLATLTINDEETITFDTTADAATSSFTLTALHAIDATSMTFTGNANTSITIGTDSPTAGMGNVAKTVTISAADLTGTFLYNGSAVDIVTTIVQNVTGSSTAANTITGGSGADSILGGTSTDSLVGGAGIDTISGDTGADTITGGAGNDSMTGGSGVDVFVYLAGTDATNAAFQTANGTGDTITDFTAGAGGDTINWQSTLLSINGSVNTVAGYQTGATDTAIAVGTTVYELSGVTTSGTAADLVTLLGTAATDSGINAGDRFVFINYTADGAQVWAFTDTTGDNVDISELTLAATLTGVALDAFVSANIV